MKKILILFISFALCSSAYSLEYFFNKSIGYWTIYGHPGDASKNLHPACILQSKWKDGSYINLIQDLTDGELLIEFKSNDWNVTNVDLNATYDMTINMYNSSKTDVKSWQAKFNFISKNAINIRGISIDTFLPNFMNYSLMRFIPPGTIPSVDIQLQNSTNAIGIMSECLSSSKNKTDPSKTEGPLQQGI